MDTTATATAPMETTDNWMDEVMTAPMETVPMDATATTAPKDATATTAPITETVSIETAPTTVLTIEMPSSSPVPTDPTPAEAKKMMPSKRTKKPVVKRGPSKPVTVDNTFAEIAATPSPFPSSNEEKSGLVGKVLAAPETIQKPNTVQVFTLHREQSACRYGKTCYHKDCKYYHPDGRLCDKPRETCTHGDKGERCSIKNCQYLHPEGHDPTKVVCWVYEGKPHNPNCVGIHVPEKKREEKFCHKGVDCVHFQRGDCAYKHHPDDIAALKKKRDVSNVVLLKNQGYSSSVEEAKARLAQQVANAKKEAEMFRNKLANLKSPPPLPPSSSSPSRRSNKSKSKSKKTATVAPVAPAQPKKRPAIIRLTQERLPYCPKGKMCKNPELVHMLSHYHPSACEYNHDFEAQGLHFCVNKHHHHAGNNTFHLGFCMYSFTDEGCTHTEEAHLKEWRHLPKNVGVRIVYRQPQTSSSSSVPSRSY